MKPSHCNCPFLFLFRRLSPSNLIFSTGFIYETSNGIYTHCVGGDGGKVAWRAQEK